MALREAYTTFQTGSEEVNRLQSNLRRHLAQLGLIPYLDGVIPTISINGSTTEYIPIGTTDTRVVHGLGRKPQGWVILDKTAAGDVWRSGPYSTQADGDRILVLRASAATTVRLWVF